MSQRVDVLSWQTLRLVVVSLLLSVSAANAQTMGLDRAQQLKDRDQLMADARKLGEAGKLDDAVALAEEVLAIDRELHDAAHPAVAADLVFLAELYRRTGDTESAANAQREAAAIQAKLPRQPRAAADAKTGVAISVANLTDEQQSQLAEAARLKRQSNEFHKARRIPEAIATASQVVALTEKALGPNSIYTATMLVDLASLHVINGDHARALPLFNRALTIREEELGADHPDTGETLSRMAAFYQISGNYAAAMPLQKRALAIQEKAFGREHASTATALERLARLHEHNQEYALSLPLRERVFTIRKRALGDNHLYTAKSQSDLGFLYRELGDCSRALPHLQAALATRVARLGASHEDTIESLNHLSLLYHEQGNVAAAYPLSQKAVSAAETALGPDHPHTAISLNNLALLCQAQGNYAQTQLLLKRAFSINEKTRGAHASATAAVLVNLGALYEELGDNSQAQMLYNRALPILESTVGGGHRSAIKCLNNLAGTYQVQRDYERAISCYERAAGLLEKRLGPNHPDTACCLNNISQVHMHAGNYSEAAQLAKRAQAIMEAACRPNHPLSAVCMFNQACLLRMQGDFAQAEDLYQRALAIRESALGSQHLETAVSLSGLGDLHKSKGDDIAALSYFAKALATTRPLVELTADVQSERQQLAMTGKLRFYLDSYLACLLSAGEDSGAAYSEVLAWKGAVTARQREARMARGGVGSTTPNRDPELAGALAELQATASRLATLVFATPSAEQRADWQREIAELSAKKEDLEGKLSGLSSEFRRQRAQRELTAAALQQVLPSDAAIVDFLEYWHSSPPPDGKGGLRFERQVVAFVVRRDRPIQAFGLGSAAKIAAAVDAWRQEFGAGGVGGRLRSEPLPRGEGHTGAKLRQLVWEPLVPHLDGVKTVLVSPDGALTRFPMAALPGSKPGTYLIEEMAISVLPVPQMLPETLTAKVDDLRSELATNSLLVVGDVDFGALPGAAAVVAEARSAPRGTTADPLKSWPPLAGTGPEMRAVRDSFGRGYRDGTAVALDKDQATEEQVRQRAPEHRFLHLATHGFFASPQVRSALAPVKDDFARHEFRPTAHRDVVGFHPGLLSGLVLAGANRPVEPDKDDGILTALEVAELNLSGVELATLSACETGLGESAGGEGLLGLQRAFQVAGAWTTVASLWQVPDQATRTLMTRFYENLWQKKLPKLEALREAQIWMLREGVKQPELWRGKGEEVDFDREKAALSSSSPGLPPRYWAAFVLSGDWR